MSWLDRFFTNKNYGTIQINGVPLPPEMIFNFISGASAVDDPTNQRTNISVIGSTGFVTDVSGTAPIISSGGTTPAISISAATTSNAGSMSAADKTKLDGIQKQGASVAISAMNIDWSIGGTFSKTLAAGANTFTFSNATDGWTIVVEVTGAASTLTWPTVEWAGGTPPTQTTSGTDIYTFVKIGSTIFGSVVQAMA